MTIRQVVEAIELQTGELASYESVRYQLTRSRAARRGEIIRVSAERFTAALSL